MVIKLRYLLPIGHARGLSLVRDVFQNKTSIPETKQKNVLTRVQMEASLLFPSLYLLYLLAIIVYVELVLSVAVINYECILPES